MQIFVYSYHFKLNQNQNQKQKFEKNPTNFLIIKNKVNQK